MFVLISANHFNDVLVAPVNTSANVEIFVDGKASERRTDEQFRRLARSHLNLLSPSSSVEPEQI